MTETPWTDVEPQPGDFDADLGTIDPRYVASHHGDPNAKVRTVLSIEGEDASCLQRISAARGEKATDVIAELLREPDRPAG